MGVTTNGHAPASDAEIAALMELAYEVFGETATQQFADRRKDMTAIGDTGLNRFGGIVYEDPIPKLRGREWLRIIREMTTTSPIIAGMLFAVEMLIRRAEWNVEAAKDSGEEGEKVAEFVRSCLYDMRTPWEDTLATSLSFLPYGWSLMEITYKRRLGWEGKTPSSYTDGLIGWADWSPRSQETLVKWIFDDSGYVTGFEQHAPSQSSPVTISLDRCLHFKTGGYAASPEGKSILRSAYVDWDALNKLQLIEAIGIERDLAGLPVALVPPRYLSANKNADETRVYNAIVKIVEGVRQNERAGVVFPLEYDPVSGKPTFDFKLLSAGGSRQFNTSEVIIRRQTQMTMSILADFLMLGHQSTGTYSLSEDKTRLFTTATSAWLDLIANVINDQAIKPLMRMNAIPPERTPLLKTGPLDAPNLIEMGQYFTSIQPIFSILNDVDKAALAGHFFDIADWPQLSTTAAEIKKNREAAIEAANPPAGLPANGPKPNMPNPPKP